MAPDRGLDSAPRVGERSGSRRGVVTGARPRGVQVSVLGVDVLECSLEGVFICLEGDDAGPFKGAFVEFRSGDGEAGDSGRRKGDVRGELKESGDGLYDAWAA
jgi:hypothetical protein